MRESSVGNWTAGTRRQASGFRTEKSTIGLRTGFAAAVCIQRHEVGTHFLMTPDAWGLLPEAGPVAVEALAIHMLG